jgi:hypothetical protein
MTRQSEISEIQASIASRLSSLHGGVESQTEWSTMRGHPDFYSPRLDVAVGPFATGNLQCGRDFDTLLKRCGTFVRCAYDLSNENFSAFGERNEIFDFGEVTHRNWNARCFIAIEIENKVTRKHLMGGAVNAAALGRLGIAVGWTQDKVIAFVKLRTYLLYLAALGKNTFHPINLLVLSKEQLSLALRTAESARNSRRQSTVASQAPRRTTARNS